MKTITKKLSLLALLSIANLSSAMVGPTDTPEMKALWDARKAAFERRDFQEVARISNTIVARSNALVNPSGVTPKAPSITLTPDASKPVQWGVSYASMGSNLKQMKESLTITQFDGTVIERNTGNFTRTDHDFAVRIINGSTEVVRNNTNRTASSFDTGNQVTRPSKK